MLNTEMSETLLKIVELSSLVYSKESYWKIEAMKLQGPAQETDIVNLSLKLPFRLPPSYCQFLRMHNGSLNFWPCFALLGVDSEPGEIIKAEVQDAKIHQRKFACNSQGKITDESIAKFETPKLGWERLYLPSHIVFGTNQGGEFLVFNEKKLNKNEEYEVIHYTFSGGIYERYECFPVFLEKTVEELQKRIKDKKYAKKKK